MDRIMCSTAISIFPRGLVVRIPPSHGGGRGSIPRTGSIFFSEILQPTWCIHEFNFNLFPTLTEIPDRHSCQNNHKRRKCISGCLKLQMNTNMFKPFPKSINWGKIKSCWIMPNNIAICDYFVIIYERPISSDLIFLLVIDLNNEYVRGVDQEHESKRN